MIARGAAPFVFGPLVAMLPFAALALLLRDPRWSYASIPLGLAFLFSLVFFRDPYRVKGAGIVSPADGRVLVADADRGRLVVFMGILNVHVNRAPFDGRVASVVHTRGGHAPAYAERAARNERVETVFETRLGRVTMTQVAGVFARRIVPYVRRGDAVRKGQRVGMIRFGSRVELVLPPGVRFTVQAGDKVRAGETTVAEVVDAPRP